MAKIRIEKTWDSVDCETCGCSYADGARIYIDGLLVEELKPVASCFGGESYDDEAVFAAALKHLGHKLVLEAS
jgi:hypothetical protein